MRTVLHWVLLAGLSVLFTSCGESSPPTLTGIAVQPHSILAWPDQLFTAVGVYSDGSTGPLSAEFTWSQDTYWVRIDVVGGSSTMQANAVCLSPAPLIGAVLPQPAPATITTTAIVNGRTFSATGTLYCH